MVEFLDRVELGLLDAGIATMAWQAMVMLAMVAFRQPIMRRDLARVGVVGTLLLIPMSAMPWTARIGWAAPIVSAFEPLVRFIPMPTMTRWLDDGAARWLCVLYAVGVGLGLGWTLLGGLALRRLVLNSAEPSAMARSLYDALPFEGVPGRRPRLRVSPGIGRPVLIGPIWPTILIPIAWDEAEQGDRLRLGLQHELAHAERRDPVFHLLGSLAQAAWFALPTMWWMRRQLILDQEFLADDRAARRFGASSAYAVSLLDMASVSGRSNGPEIRPVRTRSPRGTGEERAHDSEGSPLVQRIAMLVRCPFAVETRSPLWWRLAIPMLAVPILLLASRLTVGRDASIGSNVEAGTRSRSTPVGRFQISALSLSASQGRSDLYPLPVEKPKRFSLSMEVLAMPGDLPRIAVAGYRLGDPSRTSSPPLAGVEPEVMTWRRVEMIHDSDLVRLWVDGQPRPAVPDDLATSTSMDRLTIRPAPDRACRIRNLSILIGREVSGSAPRPAR